MEDPTPSFGFPMGVWKSEMVTGKERNVVVFGGEEKGGKNN